MTSEDAETDAIAILAATLFPCLSRYRVMYLRKESIPLGRVRSEIGTHPVRYDPVRISSWAGKMMCVHFFCQLSVWTAGNMLHVQAFGLCSEGVSGVPEWAIDPEGDVEGRERQIPSG